MRGHRNDTEQQHAPRRRSRRFKVLRITVVALGLVVAMLYGMGANAAQSMNPSLVMQSLAVMTTGPACGPPEVMGNDGVMHYAADCPFPLGISDEPPPVPTGPNGTLVVLGDSFTAGEGAPFGISRVEKTRYNVDYWAAADNYYYPGTDIPDNRCHRSPMAYGPRMAEQLGMTLDFRACSGATSSDYFGAQLSDDGQASQVSPRPGDTTAFPDDTAAVVFSFGGNDVGFADVVKNCLFDGYLPLGTEIAGISVEPILLRFLRSLNALQCQPEAERRTRCLDYGLGIIVDGALPNADECRAAGYRTNDIASVMASIAAEAPAGAPVVSLSYPYAFPRDPDGACGFGSGTGAIMDEDEQRAINIFVDGLDDRIARLATEAGIRHVDMRNGFQNHGLCVNPEPDGDPTTVNGERWMNRVRLGYPAAGEVPTGDPQRIFPDIKESAHPNVYGQQAYLGAAVGCFQAVGFCTNASEARNNEEAAATARRQAEHIAEITANTDWYAEAVAARGCANTVVAPSPGSDENTQTTVDVTEDGYPDMLVELRCPTGTGSSPMEVVVFDLQGDQPAVLGHLQGDEQDDAYFSLTADLTTSGRDISIAGRMFGPTDPPCCPLHFGAATWRWDGAEFRLQEAESALTDQPIRHEGLPDGTYYGILRGAFSGEVYIDQVIRYEGAEAQAACNEDGVTPSGPGECTDVYFRNQDQLVRAMAIVGPVAYTPDEFSEVTVRPADLGTLDTDFPVSDDDLYRTGPVFRFGVSGGEVTHMEPGYF
ncbi:SGNH/GDSL hydrolase family protein [Modestobacter sp. VKM Ac-2979]|uniref:SGNH/GDSL hydrolase family protein n=1 Tax=unclassified Modestobacter TaxID=2643866 RepID=UPI0022ABC2D5|nr:MULTISPECIES: SGNH/GDSL hydrolase family protein [unclassified Modestobacter]MCZ2812117.1 SGNH/GDSL hydrolase family protein [Modestobacter sp. VKM Ac-2979]MCZ2843841.1 SGNH/GDSL hydrolase family protein [Modestobacter sp. VKM Ac-2980]